MHARWTTLSFWLLVVLAATSMLSGTMSSAQQLRADIIDVPTVGEGLHVHNLFQSNMVLQRAKPVAIWGWATPDDQVTVTFGGQTASTVAADDRTWRITLEPMLASAEPRVLVVASGDHTVTLENVLVGDVWVLGGQSNMEHPLARVENGPLEIASANFPDIRILTVPYNAGPEPEVGFPRLREWSDWFGRHYRKGYWDSCTPEIASELSAIGFVFARRIHMAAQVPIGVIDVSRGGTTVETWAPDAVLRGMQAEPVVELLAGWDQKIAEWDAEQDLANRIAQHEQYIRRMNEQGNEIPSDRIDPPTDLCPGPSMDHNRPGNCFGGMIAPLAGFSVKGAIFHQGYNNCFNGTPGAVMYRQVFPEMIHAWREAFNDPTLPFGILSLCTQGTVQTRDDFAPHMADAGPFIREAQYQTYLQLLNDGDESIGFVSTYDLQRRWYHPQLKVPAGERIARWALATAYGMRQIKWQPPILEEMTVEGGRIVLKFDRAVDAIDNGLPIEGFAIAGEDRAFHPAVAEHRVTGQNDRGQDQIDRTTIVLTCHMVPEPIAYRYAWARSPMGNTEAYHLTDIPLATQRSDDWPLEATPLGVFEDGPPKELNRGQRNQLIQALRNIDLHRRAVEAEAFLREHESLLENRP